jgi:hypothetical protein
MDVALQFDLMMTDQTKVQAFARDSTSSGEDASEVELVELRKEIADRFNAGMGAFEATKDVGVFRAQRS